MIRTAWVYLVGLIFTLYHGTRVVVHGALKTRRSPEVSDTAARKWSAQIAKAAGVTIEYENADRLQEHGAQILVANHQSWFDVFVLAATLPVTYRFVAKKELAKIPLFGAAWQTAGHYAIDRSDRQAAIDSLRVAGEHMRKAKHTVVMFPEGTRSDTGKLGPFKKGASMLAITAQVPIVPVGLVGTRDLMPKGRWKVRGGRVKVRVGEPIMTTGMVPGDRERLTTAAHTAVAQLVGQLGPPARQSHEPPPTPPRALSAS